MVIDTSQYMTIEEATDLGPITGKRLMLFGIRLWQEDAYAREQFEALTMHILQRLGYASFDHPQPPRADVEAAVALGESLYPNTFEFVQHFREAMGDGE